MSGLKDKNRDFSSFFFFFLLVLYSKKRQAYKLPSLIYNNLLSFKNIYIKSKKKIRNRIYYQWENQK